MTRTALGLTRKQELYLRGICQGDQRREVAEAAFVSPSTVRATLNAVYKRLGARNAAAACHRLGMDDQRESEGGGEVANDVSGSHGADDQS